MKSKKLFMAATAMCAALSITSCSTDDDIVINLGTGTTAEALNKDLIYFGGFHVGANTRAIIDNNNIAEAGVKIYAQKYAPASNFTPTKIDLFNGLQLTYKDGAWTHDQPTSWEENRVYNFMAFSPADLETSAWNDTYNLMYVSIRNLPIYQEAATGKDALMGVSNGLTKETAGDNGVQFDMQHMLGTLSATIKNVGDHSVRVRSASFHVPAASTIANYNAKDKWWTQPASGPNYDGLTTPVDSLYQTYEFGEITLTKENNSVTSPKYLVIPMKSGATFPLFLNLSYDILNAKGEVINSVNVKNKKVYFSASKGVEKNISFEFNPDTHSLMIRTSSIGVADFNTSDPIVTPLD